jgi:hypothetical protein
MDRRLAYLLPLFALLLTVVGATSALCAELQIAPDAGLPALRVAGAVRVDFRTVILTPSPRSGWLHVAEFVAFRTASAESLPFFLFQPVEGVPETISAQAMTMQTFDALYTDAARLERAFFERARAERTVARCLFGTIGANGGLPAWALLKGRWSLSGPAITAVATLSESPAPAGLHSVQEVRVLHASELRGRAGLNASERARAAVGRLREGSLVVVSGTCSASEREDVEGLAMSGVAISYDAPMRSDAGVESFQMPLLGDSPERAAALTRIYAVIPSSRAGEVSFPVTRGGEVSPQRLVNDALAGFGRSTQFSKIWAAEHAGLDISFVRSEGGGATSRLTAAFRDISGDIRITQRHTFTGIATVVRQKVGAVVLRGLWPLAAAAYLLGIWAGLRVYFWLTGTPRRAEIGRKHALIAALGPVLTPWFMLRFAGRPDDTMAKDDEGGALGVLSASTYDCLARLIVWGLLVCGGWAVMGAITRAALALRFD